MTGDSAAVDKSDLAQVLVCSFILNGLIIGGPLKSLGVYFIELQDEFEVSAGQTSLVVTLLYTSFYLFGPLTAVLSNIFGFRAVCSIGCALVACGSIISSFSNGIALVYITMGILTGGGACMASNCTFAVLGKLFKKKRSFANNVYTTGSAFLSIPMAPLLQYLIYVYGWRGSILILGALLLNAIPASLLMISKRVTKTHLTDTKRRVLDLTLLKSPIFILLVVANGLHMASMMMISIYLIRYAQFCGVNSYLAALLSSIIGFVDILVRPFSGLLTSMDSICGRSVKRSYVFAVAALLQSMVVICFTFVQEYYQFVIVTAMYAICISFVGALPVTILSDFFGVKNLASSLGLRAAIMGVITLTIPVLIGVLVDKTNSYYVPFYSSVLLAILASGTATVTQLLQTRREKLNKGST